MYILDTNPLSDKWFAYIFSHSKAAFMLSQWCPLKHIYMYFTFHNVIYFFSFCVCSLVSMKEAFVIFEVMKIYLYVFFQELYNFSSYIYVSELFWTNFCIWCEVRSNFILLPVAIYLSTPFLERLCFLLFNSFGNIVKIQLTMCMSLFLDSVLFYWSICVSCASVTKFWLVLLCSKFRN